MGSEERAVYPEPIVVARRRAHGSTRAIRRFRSLNICSNRAASSATASRAGTIPSGSGGSGQGLGVLDAEDVEHSQAGAGSGRTAEDLGKPSEVTAAS
jgi:hypothetical protein